MVKYSTSPPINFSRDQTSDTVMKHAIHQQPNRVPSHAFYYNGARILFFCVSLLLLILSGQNAKAGMCPFCTSVGQTFAEQIAASDVAVVAKLIEEANSQDELTLPRGKFVVIEVLRGEAIRPVGSEFSAVVVNRSYHVGDLFFLTGNGAADPSWTTPLRISPRVVEYMRKLGTLPKEGPERLAFFFRVL